MEYNGYDRSSIIDHDGAPTRSFYEFSNIFGNVSYIGNYTKAMNSTFVAYKPGQYAARGEAPSLSGYKYGDFASGDEAKAANKAVGLVDMSVANVGSVNDGLPGDVVVGYFEQLKGLETAKSAEIFGDSTTAPKGFMVVNALDRPDPLPVLPPRPAHRQRLAGRDRSGHHPDRQEAGCERAPDARQPGRQDDAGS